MNRYFTRLTMLVAMLILCAAVWTKSYVTADYNRWTVLEESRVIDPQGGKYNFQVMCDTKSGQQFLLVTGVVTTRVSVAPMEQHCAVTQQ